MQMSRRTKDISSLIETSDDPAAIIGQLYKKYDLKNVEMKPTHKIRRRVESKTQCTETMTDDIDYMSQVSVSKWVFGTAPEARELPPTLEIQASQTHEVPETKNSGNIDDGSFANDPVLQLLRSRLQIVNQRINEQNA